MQTIREGNTGVYTQYLQLSLSRAGYPVLIDGIFGTETKRALLQMQKSYNLVQDGIAGNNTWRILSYFLRGFETYRVKNGDTVFKLAKRFRTTPQRILIANPQINPNALQIGQALIIPYGFSLVPTNVFYSYPLVKLLYEGILARYPFILGGSTGTSVMGQNLYYFKIGEGATEVFYNAAHHANEWITTPVLFKFLEEYAESFAKKEFIFDVRVDDLYQSTSLYILPMVNPDGVDLVNGAIDLNSTFFTQAKSFSSNYPKIPFPDGWKANISGIDTNLSYPAYWERAREIKFSQGFTSPAPRDYVGTAPLDAKESRAVYDFTRAHDFALTLSYHTQGEVIFWQFLDYLPPNSREIAELFSEASGYALEETPYASSFAGYKDWYILTYNRPGYTIEAGSGINPLPLSQFPKIYQDNLGILVNGIRVFTDTP